MIPFVDLRRQYDALRDELEPALLRAAAGGQHILGPEVEQFEREFASFCGTRYCVGVASGTAALQLGLEALGIGPGDEVVVPANTFYASVVPVVRLRATPVLVDVEPESGSLDVDAVAAALSDRTAAVVAVHLYGHMADVQRLDELCRRRGVALIEDACQAHGARLAGRRAGSFGRFAAFSFYPSKNLGALGDGGAITTDDPDLAHRVRVLRNLGEERKYEHVVVGWNERLDNLQAAVLRLKLTRLDEWNARRREHADAYADALAASDVEVLRAAPGTEPVWHLYPILHPDRDRLRDALAAEQVATGIHYPTPIHLQPAFSSLGVGPGAYPVAERRAREQLSLPMFAELEADEIARVVDGVRRFATSGVASVS